MGTHQAISIAALISAGLSGSQLGCAATNVVLNLKDDLTVGTLRSAIANLSTAFAMMSAFNELLADMVRASDGLTAAPIKP